jgi:hypothetical protein
MKDRPIFPIYDIMEHWAAFAFTTPEVRPVHHALYHALVYMCKRRGGAHRFNLPTQEGMQACGIAARNTYAAAMRDLEEWGFVVYTPGANALKPSIVDVKFCATAEQALSSYRSSLYTAGDASTEQLFIEVKRLKVEGEEKASALAEALADVELLKAELATLTENQGDHRPTIVAAPAPIAPDKAAARAMTDPGDEIPWRDSPLSRAESFKIICERHTFGKGIAHEHYRQLALAAVEDTDTSRTIKQWQSWIFKFLENQKPKTGSLLTPAALATEMQTGVRAPQHHNAPDHKPRPEVLAQRTADFEAEKAARITANFAKRAAEAGGSVQQPGSTARGF